MAQFGYAISSEEHTPNDLVKYAQQAERAGFTFALISDHYHPWVEAQGHSPFVWSVIGAIAQATDELRLGTGVTCPIIRIHPAIIAQAAATSAAMMPGRFFLGVGTGENLNEHVVGEGWPVFDVRLAMLEEAVEIMRELWKGETVTYWGDYFVVEDARLFTLPDEAPQIMMAASGPTALETAGKIADGLIGLAPKAEDVERFEEAGGKGKPRYGQIAVCWAPTEEEGRETVYKIWPNSGLPGELTQELRTVAHFEQAVKIVSKEQATENMICGPDAQKHIDGLRKFLDAGYDHVYIHQIGPQQEEFIRFYEKEVLPELRQR